MKTGPFFAGAAFIMGWTICTVSQKPIAPAGAQTQPSALTYRYTTVSLPQELGITGGSQAQRDDLLNRYAEQGWRVAAAIGSLVIFERAYTRPQRPAVPGMAPQADDNEAPGPKKR